ncbi:hypothetical protein GQ43DRAFT_184656 [Delitschia confertaspora ATCC 74209]|uniref:DNA polymerase lambda n=1 Tax=Delitschia confertaspora ATCC 74209 TaxID=1513339 RepID=A0A9P4JEE6_9PLEO|nr:hypothetical protein GQ43DRAFT_184656 [Delitschia confertaspora ATCC 74209]
MSEKELEEKQAYFQSLDLLNISDDETSFPDAGLLEAQYVLTVKAGATSAMSLPPRPSHMRRTSSGFLGPTPKERQMEFELRALKHHGVRRLVEQGLIGASTVPELEVEVSSNLPAATPKRSQTELSMDNGRGKIRKLTHSASFPDLDVQDLFYKRVGQIPRPIGSSKAKKVADIKLEPGYKQVLKGKIIYFFPNNDISQTRRFRIHKVIQLGAAWVTEWIPDITHIIVEDDSFTYGHLLKHLQMKALPSHVVVVKYQPYVPECIMWRKLLDPTERRFQVKEAPLPNPSAPPIFPPSPVQPSSLTRQSFLEIKWSKKDRLEHDSQKTESQPTEDSQPTSKPTAEDLSDLLEETVGEGGFTISSTLVQSSAPSNAHIPEPFNDALSEAINQAKAVSHFRLENEDSDDASRTITSPVQTPQTGSRHACGFDQNTFQCMHPNDGNLSSNPNAHTIEVLQEMCKLYDQMQDSWRTLAYRKAIATLAKQKTKTNTKEEAQALPYIGSRLAEKIEETVLTNRLRRLDSNRNDPRDQVLRLFQNIYGVGLSQANKWIQQGHRTLDDLLQKAKLSENQKIGIMHYNDFLARIPREEVEAHGAYVRTTLQRIDLNFEVIIMGSYRRGAKDSGDIDLIITKKGASIGKLGSVVFGKLVPRLFKEGFLKASLATSHSNDGTKWHGASCLPDSTTWRRLDLLLVPEEEMGAALIYFTGNDIFNRSIRLLASKKGMRLNQKGLYKNVARGRNREKITEGTLVEGRSEKRIFRILGVPWRQPEQRIC